jgi:hypothetical protein
MINEGVLALLIPFAALCIPIVAILTKHQQTMASMFAQRAQGNSQLTTDELAALRREILELKTLVHQQAIAIDNLSRPNLATAGSFVSTTPPAVPESVSSSF